jgi:hypothetical protein
LLLLLGFALWEQQVRALSLERRSKMTRSRYSKQDYELVARVVRNVHRVLPGSSVALGLVLHEFIHAVYQDNPKFDIVRFQDAAKRSCE